MKKITELTAELAAPAIAEAGCTLWDVEYVKEAGTWYLRVLLDKEGGVDILDCEAVSRKLSDLLDEADPIEGSYTLEVGSAGAERALKRPSDFQRFLNSPVLVKLYRKPCHLVIQCGKQNTGQCNDRYGNHLFQQFLPCRGIGVVMKYNQAGHHQCHCAK